MEKGVKIIHLTGLEHLAFNTNLDLVTDIPSFPLPPTLTRPSRHILDVFPVYIYIYVYMKRKKDKRDRDRDKKI